MEQEMQSRGNRPSLHRYLLPLHFYISCTAWPHHTTSSLSPFSSSNGTISSALLVERKWDFHHSSSLDDQRKRERDVHTFIKHGISHCSEPILFQRKFVFSSVFCNFCHPSPFTHFTFVWNGFLPRKEFHYFSGALFAYMKNGNTPLSSTRMGWFLFYFSCK